MKIEDKMIQSKGLEWILRCPNSNDADELSILRVQIDGETEFLDREPGEACLSPQDFEQLIETDLASDRTIFILAQVDGQIAGYARCEGSSLKRYKHKAEFGICLTQKFCGFGIGRVLMELIIAWADEIGIKKISLKVVRSNVSAMRLYSSLGFVEEGILKNDRIHKDGCYYDTVMMGRFLD